MSIKWLFQVRQLRNACFCFFLLFVFCVFLAFLPKPKNTSAVSLGDDAFTAAKAGGTGERMKFSLLSRDNKGRIETKQLLVPKENAMAQKLAKAEEEARLEKLKIKERTLQLHSLSTGDNDYYDESVDPTLHTIPYSSEIHGSAASSLSSAKPSSNKGAAGDRSNIVIPLAPRQYHKGKHGHNSIRAEETRRAPDTLNLDEFLAETNASEMRSLRTRKN
jgi:hypothetical protein